jgi:hypothetical protein
VADTRAQPPPGPSAGQGGQKKPPGKKYAGLTGVQWGITGAIAIVGIGIIIWRKNKASQAAAATTAATSSTDSGAGSGTCPDGSTVDCGGLCPDGSAPQGCTDQSGAISTLQTELGDLESQLASGAGGGGGTSTTSPSVPGQPATTPPPATTSTGTTTGTTTSTGTTTGTAAASWSFPAPTGLKSYDVAKNGYRLSWDAVTGPNGQKPASYTVQTWENGKPGAVNEHVTTAGSTSTAEYGPGGTGLPKGTYRTDVWANGGPKAPPHATTQVTLSG